MRARSFIQLLGLAALALALLALTSSISSNQSYYRGSPRKLQGEKNFKTIRYANFGNSMQFTNDLPRLLEQMLTDKGYAVIRDEYLRGGANLSTLWGSWKDTINKVLGWEIMEDILTKRSAWDFIIVNDHTQWPAREETRQESVIALRTKWAPILKEYQPLATPVFLQTPGYGIAGKKNSADLGDFDHFTRLLTKGYASYKATLDDLIDQKSRIAPTGQAYSLLHETNKELWEELYSRDGFHPSPYGQLLQVRESLAIGSTAIGGIQSPSVHTLTVLSCRDHRLWCSFGPLRARLLHRTTAIGGNFGARHSIGFASQASRRGRKYGMQPPRPTRACLLCIRFSIRFATEAQQNILTRNIRRRFTRVLDSISH